MKEATVECVSGGVGIWGHQLETRLGVGADSLAMTPEQIIRRALLGYDVLTFGVEVETGLPAGWQADVEAVARALGKNKLLILSVMPTPYEVSGWDVLTECVMLARMARRTRVPVVELNAAGSSVDRQHRQLFTHLPMVARAAGQMKDILGEQIKLILKVGCVEGMEAMRLMWQTQGSVDGWSVEDGLATVETLARFRQELGLSKHVLLAAGEITRAEQVRPYLDAGADLVQTTAEAVAREQLALEYRQYYQGDRR